MQIDFRIFVGFFEKQWPENDGKQTRNKFVSRKLQK